MILMVVLLKRIATVEELHLHSDAFIQHIYIYSLNCRKNAKIKPNLTVSDISKG